MLAELFTITAPSKQARILVDGTGLLARSCGGEEVVRAGRLVGSANHNVLRQLADAELGLLTSLDLGAIRSQQRVIAARPHALIEEKRAARGESRRA